MAISLYLYLSDTFVARMDAKADRKNKVLLIHNLHFEDVALSNAISGIAEALKVFGQFNGCRDIFFSRSNNDTYLSGVSKNFS